MPVAVTWQDVELVKEAAARPQDGGWFIVVEQPMPVGTTLTLRGEVEATVQVVAVQEGPDAGMLVRAGSAQNESANADGIENENETDAAPASDDGAAKGTNKSPRRKRRR